MTQWRTREECHRKIQNQNTPRKTLPPPLSLSSFNRPCSVHSMTIQTTLQFLSTLSIDVTKTRSLFLFWIRASSRMFNVRDYFMRSVSYVSDVINRSSSQPPLTQKKNVVGVCARRNRFVLSNMCSPWITENGIRSIFSSIMQCNAAKMNRQKKTIIENLIKFNRFAPIMLWLIETSNSCFFTRFRISFVRLVTFVVGPVFVAQQLIL